MQPVATPGIDKGSVTLRKLRQGGQPVSSVVAYAREGVRMNAVAPGITLTPLSEQVMSDAALGPAIRQFGEMVPWGGTARPEQIAAVMRFLLGPEADYVCGSVLFVDGGSDAMLRPDAL